MEKQRDQNLFWKLFRAGGWFPLTVYIVNLFLKYVVDIYRYWGRADLPIHIVGGFSIAYFISGIYRLIPHETARRHRMVLLELILMGSLTATVALFWEFGEYAIDVIWEASLQDSLRNTMLDLGTSLIGAFFMIVIRARQLNAGKMDIKQLLTDLSG